MVTLQGELDHHAARALCPRIDSALYQYKRPQLVLELSQVKFMDSAGLGLILGRHAKVSALGGSLKLRNPSPGAEKLLMLAGMREKIETEQTATAAHTKKEG